MYEWFVVYIWMKVVSLLFLYEVVVFDFLCFKVFVWVMGVCGKFWVELLDWCLMLYVVVVEYCGEWWVIESGVLF